MFTMYEGWDAEKEKANRSTLVGKTMLAGMEKSTEFHEKGKPVSGKSTMRMKSGRGSSMETEGAG